MPLRYSTWTTTTTPATVSIIVWRHSTWFHFDLPTFLFWRLSRRREREQAKSNTVRESLFGVCVVRRNFRHDGNFLSCKHFFQKMTVCLCEGESLNFKVIIKLILQDRSKKNPRSKKCRTIHVLQEIQSLCSMRLFDYPISCSTDWLIDWLADWFIIRSNCRLIDWAFLRLIDCLINPLIDWLIDWLIDYVLCNTDFGLSKNKQNFFLFIPHLND